MIYEESRWLASFQQNASETNLALRRLSRAHSFVFAACCCERLVPNYHAFTHTTKLGVPRALDDGLALIWEVVFGALPEAEHVHALLHECEAATPDLEEVGGFWASAALDAAASVSYTLEFLQGGDVGVIEHVASLTLNSVDVFVQTIGQPKPQDPIDNERLQAWAWWSPLVQAELRRQQDDLAVLQGQQLPEQDLTRLRQNSQQSGIQPFTRGLVNSTP